MSSSLGTINATSYPNVVFNFTECRYFVGVTKLAGFELKNLAISAIVLPVSIVEFGEEALRGITLLNTINIPPSTVKIEQRVLGDNYCVSTILCYPEVPPTISSYTFYRNFNVMPRPDIYVPDNSVIDYKAATYWSAFSSYIHPLSEYGGED